MAWICFEERFLASPLPSDWKPVREGKLICIAVDPGVSVAGMIQVCGLKFIQPMVALINEKTADLDQTLEEGDRVRLLPQIAGGTF